MNDPVERCPHCNATMVTYKHGLSKTLMTGLRSVMRSVDASGQFDIGKVELSHPERQNLPKLKYFSIIEKVGDADGHGGRWRVTDVGMRFVTGKLSLRKSRRTYRNEVVETFGDYVFITDVTGGWKYRPDYVRESRPFNPDPQQPLPL